MTVLSAYARLAARGAQHLIYDVNIPAERTVRSFYGCPEDGIKRLHRFRNRQDKLGLQVSHHITILCQSHIIWILCSTAVPSTAYGTSAVKPGSSAYGTSAESRSSWASTSSKHLTESENKQLALPVLKLYSSSRSYLKISLTW